MEKEYYVCLFWVEEKFEFTVTSNSEKEAIEKAIQEATLIEGWIAKKDGAKTILNRADRITKIVCIDNIEHDKEKSKEAENNCVTLTQ